jgi:hypothetical protein
MQRRSDSLNPGFVSRRKPTRPRAIVLLLASCCAYATVPPDQAGDGSPAAAASASPSGTTQVFTDRAAFVAALADVRSENKFNDVAPGSSGGLRYSRNGFEYLIFTQFGARSALYNGVNSISTDRATDEVVLTFTNDAPVTAIGANFWSTDFAQRPISGIVTVTLSDGTTETIDSTGPSGFIGFIAPAPIFGFTVDAPDIADAPPGTSPDRWPTMTNLIIGSGS